MLKNSLLFVLFVVSIQGIQGQTTPKNIAASRVSEKIQINGLLDEEAWKSASKAVDFTERNPTEGKPARFPTEVSIIYSDYAIYVGAKCYDTAPDSILRQLGERDDDLNADIFSVFFDTYDKKQDAFVFTVSASGVQKDYRFSDNSYNAVWHSAVKISPDGWSVEMEIPFSALRFANNDSIDWNVQFEREIRRFRSEVQWSLVSKLNENPINYWGKLKGLTDLKNPVRLQFSPYLSANFSERAGSKTFGYGGGADMKFGLSEAFTLDMTLLPDFSQVLSDNIVKNLGAFEVVFQEQRPFFQEGVDLFNLGGLFYSRRIGGVPQAYYTVEAALDSNEVLKENPQVARLMNVTKISGRTKKGTGVGVLNAISNESFATFQDTLTGRERQVKTNPYVNYNIVAVDQNLKNNSSIYLINLNTTRASGFADANSTSIGTNLVNKKNKYSLYARAMLTQVEDTLNWKRLLREDKGNDGMNYVFGVSKIKGQWRWDLTTENKSPNFNPNDLGVNFNTNYRRHVARTRYNFYNPFWKLNQWYNTLTYSIDQNYSSAQILRQELNYSGFATVSKSFHSFFMDMSSLLKDGIDLFESRVTGQPFVRPSFFYVSVGISSDYRRAFALDGNFGVGKALNAYGGNYYDGRIAPIIRLSDKFTLRPSLVFEIDDGNVGFAGYDSLSKPFYGRRKISTFTTIIAAKYLFRNNLSLTIRMRHYWSIGSYYFHGDLDQEGYLLRNNLINENTDFNFNAFNADFIFAWQVAPGSFLNVVYKRSLISDVQNLEYAYFRNLSSTFEDSPLNVLTLKFIYFFDVASMKRRSK